MSKILDMPQERGKLIVIEGPDGSGKEDQTKRLVSRLRREKVPVSTMSFPRYNTPTGRIIGQAYLGKERPEWGGDSGWFGDADKVDPKVTSLYYAADRLSAKPKIERNLRQERNMVLDRWVESNMAHQGGKKKNLRDIMEIVEFIHNLEYNLLELPKPDLVLLLNTPAEVALVLTGRRYETRDGHENLEHLKRTENTYTILSALKSPSWPYWKRIDCVPDGTMASLRKEEDIAEEVYQHAMEVISK